MGATVDIYIQDSLLGHNGFQLATSHAYKDTMLNKYLECFNSSSLHENQSTENICRSQSFFIHTIVKSEMKLKNAVLNIYNAYGVKVKQINNIYGNSISLTRENLPNGLYFLHILQNSKIRDTHKIVISE